MPHQRKTKTTPAPTTEARTPTILEELKAPVTPEITEDQSEGVGTEGAEAAKIIKSSP
jgi:hypothetical protein